MRLLSSAESVLVIKPSSLGDVVHTLPSVALMKRQFPGVKITWVVNEVWAPLLEGNSDVDEVVEFPRGQFRGAGGALGAVRWMRRELRGLRPDVALDFQGLLRSALMARFSGAGNILGLARSREGARFFYDRAIETPEGVHAVDRYLLLAEEAGVRRETAGAGSASDGGETGLPFSLPAGVRPAGAADEAIELPEKFVLLHPVSRGAGKTFPPEQEALFCEALSPMPVVVVGQDEDEDEDQDEDQDQDQAGTGLPSPAPAFSRVIDLRNRTSLHELIWLMRRAAGVVSVDSGPMHLAAAVNRNVLGIHTWTDPRKVGPYGAECLVWKAGAVRRMSELGTADDEDLAEDRSAKQWTLKDGDVEEIARVVWERVSG